MTVVLGVLGMCAARGEVCACALPWRAARVMAGVGCGWCVEWLGTTAHNNAARHTRVGIVVAPNYDEGDCG